MIDKKRVLVIDDEPDICDILKINLEMAGFYVDTALSAEEAFKMDLNKVDIILLDVMMKGMNGFEMMAKIKANKLTADIPVLFITAKDEMEDLLHGFRLGADDYISKPFHVSEVVARVKAVLNRTIKAKDLDMEMIRYKNIVVDTVEKSVQVDGMHVYLTKLEFEMLLLFLSNPGKVFQRQHIIQQVWPKDVIVSDRTIDVNITRLRKKLGQAGDYICTRQGYGYFLN